jgi:hypothetical protein
VIYLTLAPLILGSTLCYGWLRESRNYMPVLPIMATMALGPLGALPGRKETASVQQAAELDALGTIDA